MTDLTGQVPNALKAYKHIVEVLMPLANTLDEVRCSKRRQLKLCPRNPKSCSCQKSVSWLISSNQKHHKVWYRTFHLLTLIQVIHEKNWESGKFHWSPMIILILGLWEEALTQSLVALMVSSCPPVSNNF